MKICIQKEVLEKYPQMEVGYLVAKVVVKKSEPYIEELKLTLKKELLQKGILATNYAIHPDIAIWRKIYERDFQVSNCRSSIEALVKRVACGKELWRISSVVDLYNATSLLTLLPMGGYDLQKIAGDIAIRYAKENEPFTSIGERESIQAKKHQVVYADDDRIICYLWNYKDAVATCISEETKEVIFFVDSVEAQPNRVLSALKLLSHHLSQIGAQIMEHGILNSTIPHASLNIVA